MNARTLRLVALIVAALPPHPLEAGAKVLLDGAWQFTIDSDLSGFRKGWQRTPPAYSETVTLPHTWNIGKHEEHIGTAWYFKTIVLPQDLRNKRVELHVGAAFYRAHVFVNGSEVGTHEGGHTAFYFDVTSYIRRENLIAIEVDNTPGRNTIPGWALRLVKGGNVWYDWWPYGGLVRGAWLEIHESGTIRRQEIRSKIDAQGALVTDRVFVDSFSATEPLEVRAQLFAPGTGRLVGEAAGAVPQAPGKDVPLRFRVTEPQLWYLDQPNLYRIEARLVDRAGAVLELSEDTLGIRSVEIRDRGLYLNGERIRLSGLTRHEDSPWEGLAETAGTIRRDFDELKALQATLTRPVHYPQNPDVLRYADTHGILLVPEIPVWQFSSEQLENPSVVSLAKRIMQEMIEEAGNHPSVFAWSVCNESETVTPAGREYVKTMRDFVHALDPGRYVTFADDTLPFVKDPAESAAQYADFVMMNEYFGAWTGSGSELPSVLDRVGALFPDKMFVISEFGTPGVFARDSLLADELRVSIIRDQLPEFQKRDWIAGAILWCYQDYKSYRNLWPGLVKGYVDHGVVDENRQRRPSFAVWRDANSPARIRASWRRDAQGQVTGFSAVVERRSPGEIPSYDLRGYSASWDVRTLDGGLVAHGDLALPVIGKPAAVEGSFAVSGNSLGLELTMRLLRGTGSTAAEFSAIAPNPGGMNLEELRKRGMDPLR